LLLIKCVLGVRPLSFLRVPLYASGDRTVKAPIYVRNYLSYIKIILEIFKVNDVSNAVYAAIREPMSIGQTYELYG